LVRSGFGLAVIKREIAKCIVLCANCHEIEHYEAKRNRCPSEKRSH
jgi:hypothetical protein